MQQRRNIIDAICHDLYDRALTKEEISQKKLLIQSIPKFTEISRQEIALYTEIAHSHPGIRGITIPEEININTRNSDHVTALYRACETIAMHRVQHVEIVRALVEAKADPNIQCGDKDETALMIAIRHAHWKLAHILIVEAKADLSIRENTKQNTALHCAVDRSYSYRTLSDEWVQSLIEAKADVNLRNQFGMTALFYAAHDGSLTLTMTYKLIKAGTDLEIKYRNHEGVYQTVLESVVTHARINWLPISNSVPVARLLLDHNAIIRQPTKFYDLLKRADQQSPDLLRCLEHLSTQWTTPSGAQYLAVTADDKQSMMRIWDSKIAQAYIHKLRELHSKYKELCFFRIDHATKLSLPKVVVEIVMDYDERDVEVVPRDFIKFFKPTTVDSAIQKVDALLKAKEHDSKCLVM